jgi:type ISP restriction-modification system protein
MEICRLQDIVLRELSQPGGPCYLLLRFSATIDANADSVYLRNALPWFEDLPCGKNRLVQDLRSHGLGIVLCANAREAVQLRVQVRGGRLTAKVLMPESLPGKVAGAGLGEDIRRELGVYSTPSPLAGYLARSLHRLLQSRFGWSNGLADPRVRLLDPAAGSMNFLRAAWRLALEDGWHRGVEARDLLREHLLPHSLGVEILPEAHARGASTLRRFLRVYGYEIGSGERLPTLLGDALAPVPEVRDFPANVVLGNPPWRGRSTPAGDWIAGLVADYFQVEGEPLGESNSKWLHDVALKFLRLAQWKIEAAGEGIAALVLPHNGLDAPTFRGLRRSLLDTFDEIYALDLHGNRRKREQGPEGGPDENVFAGIAQGVAVFLLLRQPGLPKRVLRADLYGRRRDKLVTLAATHVGTTHWQTVEPTGPAFLFVVGDERLEREYRGGWALPEIFPVHSTGVITGRDALATDLDRQTLIERLTSPGGRLDAAQREQLRRDEGWPGRILSFLAGPFDRRFLLYAHYLLERPRTAVMAHMERGGNLALVASRQTRGAPGALVTRWIAGHKAASAYDVSSLFPLYLHEGKERVPNLAPALLATLGERYSAAPTPEEILGYVYAVLHDPGYRERYQKLLKQDFARIPFPREHEAFLHLAALGAELIGLHLLADPRLLRPPVRLAGESDPVRYRLGWGRRPYLVFRDEERRLFVNNEGLHFEGITPEAYAYQVGGHRVLSRWLRLRTGRVLLPEEVTTFCRIATALELTLAVQAKLTQAGTDLREAS